MFGRNFASIGFNLGRSLLKQNMPSFRYSTAMTHIQIQSSYLKMLPNSNTILMQNLRQMLLSKREVLDLESADLTSINQVISLILRGNQPRDIGTLKAKSHKKQNNNDYQHNVC